MTAKIILNPYAGRWSALKRQDEARKALQAAGVDFDMVLTQSPNHGTELAYQAVLQGFNPIVAAGGDGSISEVVNGMARAAQEQHGPMVSFGVLPMGSANDLVDNLSLPGDLNEAARIIAAGKTQNMDLCQVNDRFFDNNSAIGLEPYITLIQQRITLVKGDMRYLLSTLRGVMDNPKWTMRLEWQNGEYEGPISLVTVGNCPRTGGLFYVTPHANPFDGLLTFVYGYIPSRIKILQVLPKMMKPGQGNYVEHSSIHEVHSPWLRIQSIPPTPLHADGEIQSRAIQKIEFKVLPGYLPILLG